MAPRIDVLEPVDQVKKGVKELQHCICWKAELIVFLGDAVKVHFNLKPPTRTSFPELCGFNMCLMF